MMRSCVIVVVFILLLASVAFSQSNADRSLTFTGTVISVTPRWVSGENRNEVYDFDVKLYLQFRNDTDSPVIIFKPENFDGQKKIEFLERIATDRPSESPSTAIAWKNYDKFRDPIAVLVSTVRESVPHKFHFVIVDPGSYYECNEELRIKSGFTVQKSPGLTPFLRPVLSVIPEFRSFRLQYYVSLNNRPEEDASLVSAQRRWSSYGRLVLDSSGDYNLKSEIILNKLPD